MNVHGQIAVPDTMHGGDHVIDRLRQLAGKTQSRDHGEQDHPDHDQDQGHQAFQYRHVLALAGKFHGENGFGAGIDPAAELPASRGFHAAINTGCARWSSEQPGAGMKGGSPVGEGQVCGSHILFFQQGAQQLALGIAVAGVHALQLGGKAVGNQLLATGIAVLHVQKVADHGIAPHQQGGEHGGYDGHEHQA